MNTLLINIAKRQYANSKCVIPMELLIKITTYLNVDDIYHLYSHYIKYGTLFRNVLLLNKLYVPERQELSAEHPLANTIIGEKYYIINYSKIKTIKKIVDLGLLHIMQRSPYMITFDAENYMASKYYLNDLPLSKYRSVIEGANIINFNEAAYFRHFRTSLYIDAKIGDTRERPFDFKNIDKIRNIDKDPYINIANYNNTVIDNLPECKDVCILSCENLYIKTNAGTCYILGSKNIVIENKEGCRINSNGSECIDVINNISICAMCNTKKVLLKDAYDIKITECEDIFINKVNCIDITNCARTTINKEY